MNQGGTYYRVGNRKVHENDLTDADRKRIDKQRAKAQGLPADESNESAEPAATTEDKE